MNVEALHRGGSRSLDELLRRLWEMVVYPIILALGLEVRRKPFSLLH